MPRIYEPCPYIVGAWPNDHPCGKPVKIRNGVPSYCPEHSSRMPFWPTSGEQGRPEDIRADLVGPVPPAAPAASSVAQLDMFQ